MRPLWARLWNLKIPPKIKNLVWWICNGFVPVTMHLLARGLEIEFIRPVCGQTDEFLLRVFADCGFARGCWTRTLPDEIQAVCMSLWVICQHRNSVLWQGEDLPLDQLLFAINGWFCEWKSAQLSQQICPSIVLGIAQ
ncbi:uncharacterized protein LOC105642414 isoform X2 [Jatropha curcas]|uniref:uncharacterized protein LOC105642414 isoform X2 n=1 Tax=Jatropha curcas TaxID=180498 RepID=UPI0005FAEDB3|nr:uncharacterized protein LOC105642414 isoform X2 [Jatropha curcas]